ncbi:cation/H(+) antiporter 15-like [Macadamia integrifolia]|uniref:cation/H(+) antiporter 15-like n=1 Tax=Macadamia integrifolia TaxID=60698 RepID=UPI001C4F5EF4|nr:cation/H(+) antiporter 15-like [Macadamia integrifolia]
MDAKTGYEELMLPTPINGSDALTFGFRSKRVDAECIRRTGVSRGIFYGDDPFKFVEPVFLIQLIIGSLLTNFCQLLFKPLGQTSIISQIMAGFIAGPSALSRNTTVRLKLFPRPSKYVQETLSLTACVFIFFLAGVRMDIGTIKNSGKKEWSIGIMTLIVPLVLTLPTSILLKNVLTLDKAFKDGVESIGCLYATTSFHVVASFLHELKLLNSELGRLAMSSSMISVLISWIMVDIGVTIKQTMLKGDGMDVIFKLMACSLVLVTFIYYILRPIMLWMIRQTEEGKPIKQSYIYSIFIMVLGCCFVSESLGKHVALTAGFVGICVPGGPPLGSTLVEKLECFVTAVLLPLYLIVNFEDVDLYHIKPLPFFTIELLCLVGTLGKFIGTLIPCFYFDIPFKESISLGLVLSTLGLLDLQFYKSAQLLGFIDSSTFGAMCISIIMVTGFVAPLVRVIYNPSHKYRGYKKRTIQHTNLHAELPILVCVYNQESVPALINLLKATHPVQDYPMAIYLLQLIELVGRSAPLLIPYLPGKIMESQRSGRAIFNAFKIFERNNPGVNTMQAFTSVAPYATMHDDICTLALDKRVSFIIVPFHKQWHLDGGIESVSRRNINQKVLMMAPCSVGILIDRGTLTGRRSILESWAYLRVAMIFLGGIDDREALSFAMRMAQHPNVNLTVIRLIPMGDNLYFIDEIERMLDEEVIREFRLATIDYSDRVLYTEEGVTDGIGTINVILSIDDSFDLFLVGRRHDKDSPLLEGSVEWVEFPDIGFIGDILISTDFKHRVSILVVQQHGLVSKAEVALGKARLRHLSDGDMP